MPVTVRFFANVALFMGKKEVQLTLKDGKEFTVGEIIDEIDRIEGKNLRGELLGEGEKRQVGIRIVLNGSDVDFQEKTRTKVSDGDTVSIFPLLGGGQ